MSQHRFIKKEPVQKGWSGDRKYCVTDEAGERYLLRISPAEQHDRRLAGFQNMQRIARLGIPMCHPVEFGVCDEGVYALHRWIEGQDAEEVIPPLAEERQYAYGLEAGRILQKIHSLPAPGTQEEWESRFNKKIDRKIKGYNDCPIKYPGGEAFLDFIAANRHLLKNRPQTYQHGDYHIGNMMVDTAGQLQIIDFDRDDYGDPWEEFNRIVWCAQAAPAFASGMVDGYFDGHIPIEFWQLLALYISSNTLSSIYWAVPFGQNEIDTMLRQGKEVLEWYDNMRTPVPSWYCPPR